MDDNEILQLASFIMSLGAFLTSVLTHIKFSKCNPLSGFEVETRTPLISKQPSIEKNEKN